MQTINEILKQITKLMNNAPKKSFAMFWEDIDGIVQAKVYDYQMRVGQELPREFFVDVFDSYIEKYKAVNYYKELSEMNKPLSMHLVLFNEGLLNDKPINKEVFMLDDKAWTDVFIDSDVKKIKKHIPNLNISYGCVFEDIYKNYKIQYELQKEEPYERDRLSKTWKFFKSYIFRVIPDNGVIYEDDIKGCLNTFIQYETPKNRFDNEKLSDVKQFVSTYNKVFQTKIKYKDVGLSYEQLREKHPEKDGWLRTDEDEKKLQEFRKLTHYYVDMLWNGSSSEVPVKMTRAEAYSWLSSALMIPKSETHIALFSEQMCAKAILEVFHFLGR